MKLSQKNILYSGIILTVFACASDTTTSVSNNQYAERPAENATSSTYESYMQTMVEVHKAHLARFILGADGNLVSLPETIPTPEDTVWLIRQDMKMSLMIGRELQWVKIAEVQSDGRIVPVDDIGSKLAIASRIPIENNDIDLRDFQLLDSRKSLDFPERLSVSERLMIRTLSGEYVVLHKEQEPKPGMYLIQMSTLNSLEVKKLVTNKKLNPVITINSDRTIAIADNELVSMKTGSAAHWNIVDEAGMPVLPPESMILPSLLETPDMTVYEDGLVSFPQETIE